MEQDSQRYARSLKYFYYHDLLFNMSKNVIEIVNYFCGYLVIDLMVVRGRYGFITQYANIKLRIISAYSTASY